MQPGSVTISAAHFLSVKSEVCRVKLKFVFGKLKLFSNPLYRVVNINFTLHSPHFTLLKPDP